MVPFIHTCLVALAPTRLPMDRAIGQKKKKKKALRNKPVEEKEARHLEQEARGHRFFAKLRNQNTDTLHRKHLSASEGRGDSTVGHFRPAGGACAFCSPSSQPIEYHQEVDRAHMRTR